jgi:hypothetical protein
MEMFFDGTIVLNTPVGLKLAEPGEAVITA